MWICFVATSNRVRLEDAIEAVRGGTFWRPMIWADPVISDESLADGVLSPRWLFYDSIHGYLTWTTKPGSGTFDSEALHE